MADDFGSLRGWATVVPQQQGNLSAMLRQHQQARIADRDFAQKQQQKDLDWFSKEMPLGLPTVRSEHQAYLVDLFKESTGAIAEIYKSTAGSGGINENKRQQMVDIKNNYDVAKSLVLALGDDLTKIETVVSADKEGLLNHPALASRLKGIIDSSFVKNPDGSTSINPQSLVNLRGLMQDHTVWDDAAVARRYLNKLGEISSAQMAERADSYVTTQQTYTNDFYDTNPDGSTKLDPNFGRPIAKASPASIALWDGPDPNSIEKQKLDAWAHKITPDGKNWEDYRGKAFGKFLVDKFGKYKEETKINEKSSGLLGREDKKVLETDRENNIHKIVYNPGGDSERLLAQAFDPDGKLKATYVYPEGDSGKGAPIAIKVESRELKVEKNEFGEPVSTRMSDWHENRILPIGNPEERDRAKVDLNAIFNSAQPAGMAVDQGRFEQLIKKRKGSQIDLGFK